MAEFTSAMHEWARMCNAHTDNCQSCPLNGNPFCEKEIFDLTPRVIKEAEQIIMSWAAEHPVVYPTWIDVMKMYGVTDETGYFYLDSAYRPIPDDIAEKLGIKPKGE